MTSSDATDSTIQIQLTCGYAAIIDGVDADLATRKWHAQRAGIKSDDHYAAARPKGKGVAFLHRLILARIIGRPLAPGEITDHIDGNKLNNRRANLRLATFAENTRNRALNKNNTSGYKGVKKSGDRWMARIKFNKQQIYLGTFDTPKEAHAAYCEAARKYHGEFATFE